MGFPLKDKDVAYSAFDGVVQKDDRYATIKYKRQQARTEREAKLMEASQVQSNQQSSVFEGAKPPKEMMISHSIVNDEKVNTQFVKSRVE